jgi:capsular exopolysaccharide synthesis family protein
MTPLEQTEKMNSAIEGLDFVDYPVVHKGVADTLLASALVPGSTLFERFRVLRAKVKALSAERPLQCLGVMGVLPGEGATTVALGLAVALAEERRRVLLIEATLRDPVLSKRLDLVPNGGLSNWLRAEGLRPVSVRRLDPWGLRLLPGGAAVAAPTDLLGSDRMAKLLEVARRSFDQVIIDCPAVVPTADSLVLQAMIDGVLLVVRARHSYRDAILTAHGHLRPNLVQGIVFNDEHAILARRLGRQHGR